MSRDAIVDRITATSAAAMTGLVADTAAVVALLVSDSFQEWCRANWQVPAALALLFGYALVALANAYSGKAAALRSLEEQARGPSPHDRALFSSLSAAVHPGSVTIEWLKDGFVSTSFERSLMRPLEELRRNRGRDPRGFDDGEVNVAYREFLLRLGEFCDSVSAYMWHDRPHNPERLAIPREWETEQPDRYGEAVDALDARRDALVRAYDTFLLTGQRRGVTEAPVERPGRVA